MRHVILLGVAVAACSLSGAKTSNNSLPETARAEIATAVAAAAQKPHPRLFADEAGFAALRARAETDADVKRGVDYVRAHADDILPSKPATRAMEGRRLLGVSRRVLERINTLALAYRLFGNRAHLDRAVAELRAVCAFEDWNPSHFLDVAEMSLAVATGYDWLYNDLDAATRAELAAGLRAKGLDAARKPAWWITARNNWGQVCHAGILAAALALAEENPAEAACFVQRAIDKLPLSMAAYAPRGNFPEGPGYWSYATDFNVVALTLLMDTLGSDFGLLAQPGFRETADYLDLVTGPSGRTFNYADGGDGRGTDMASWWFARRLNRPAVLPYFEVEAYRKFCARRQSRSRMFAYGLFEVRAPAADAKIDLPRAWEGGGSVPIAVLRSSWTDPRALFAGFKGGSPSSNHGHMDGGSFVFEAKGVRWAVDLGAENYHKIESLGMKLWGMHQNSERWKIYRLNAWSHNELVLDNCAQNVKGFGKVLEAREAEGALSAALDLTSLYTNATHVARRGVMATDGSRFEIRDVVRGLRAGAPIRWSMVTRAKAEVAADGALVLREKGETLRLVQTGALKGAWQIAPAKGPNTWDGENKGCSQVMFTVLMPATGEAALTVAFDLPRPSHKFCLHPARGVCEK